MQSLQSVDNNNPSDENLAVASSGNESGVNPDAYRERLKKLRALAGLETNEAGANNAGLTSHFGFSATTVSQINTRTVSTISSDKVIEPIVTNSNASSSTSNVEDYRRRLDMLKSSGNLQQ